MHVFFLPFFLLRFLIADNTKKTVCTVFFTFLCPALSGFSVLKNARQRKNGDGAASLLSCFLAIRESFHKQLGLVSYFP
jgi:hypothetical protein